MADTKYDYSNKSEAALEKMMEKGSGASQEQARAAYNELSKRRGGMDFSVTLILGGRPMDKDKPKPVPLPKKKPAEPKRMNKGGYANCGASMAPTQKSSKKMAVGGMAKKSVPAGNPGLAKLPTQVRNKMGYMMKGGYAKKK
jgi:hypothetical protein